MIRRCEPDALPWHPVDGTHQRQCADCGVWADVDENPAAATESATVSGVAQGRLALLAHTRETPAKARTDRGRGPTSEESSKMDRTPKYPPAAVL